MLALKCNVKKLSEFYYEYLKIVCDMLPGEVENVVKLHLSMMQGEVNEQIGLENVAKVFNRAMR